MLETTLRRLYLFIPRRCYSSSLSLSASPPPYRILFIGSGEFGRLIATALRRSKGIWSTFNVLTTADVPEKWKRAKQRAPFSPIKEWAKQNQVQLDTLPAEGIGAYKLPSQFDERAPNDLLIVASFGHLIPPSILHRFPPSQRLNLHPSMLPELSGAAPIQWAIAKQMEKTGVTVQTLGNKFDSGDILSQKEVEMIPRVKYASMEGVLAEHGSKLLIDTLRELPTFAAKAWSQLEAPSHLIPSRAPKLKPEHSLVHWAEQTASEIYARSRGFGYLYPLRASSQQYNIKSVLLRDTFVLKELPTKDIASTTFIESERPGSAVYCHPLRCVIVKCKDGKSVLGIRTLQTQGKQEKDAENWITAYRSTKFVGKPFMFNVV